MKEIEKDIDSQQPANFDLYESTSPNIERNALKPKPGKRQKNLEQRKK